MIRFDPWHPGVPGVGYLIRTPDDETLRVELVIAYDDLNVLALMLHVAQVHGIPASETYRLFACLTVLRDGTFSLASELFSRSEVSEREKATMIEWTDARLRWSKRR